jgi:hypothetical protein
MERYEHRQYGTLMLILIVVFAAAGPVLNRTDAVFGASAAVAIAVLVVMCRLNTAVEGRFVSWSFTFGFPSGRIALSAIESVAVVRTSVWEGWGIHWTFFHGWLWNVSGFQAVEIRHDGGKRLTIGTDDPQGLVDAVERFRKDAA